MIVIDLDSIDPNHLFSDAAARARFETTLRAWNDASEIQTAYVAQSDAAARCQSLNFPRPNWMISDSGRRIEVGTAIDDPPVDCEAYQADPAADDDVRSVLALRWLSGQLRIDGSRVHYFGASANAALEAGFQVTLLNAGRVDRRTYVSLRDHQAFDRMFVPPHRSFGEDWLAGCRWFEIVAVDENALQAATEQLGAVPLTSRSTHFRVWSPKRKTVSVQTADARRFDLQRHANGYHTGVVDLSPDSRYQFLLDGELLRPDPTSRFQPQGVHQASQVSTPHRFPWRDQDWRGVAKEELVIYEMHLGSFTAGGTFLSAIERLPELVELGVTAVELLPVAQSPGKWNWGYDGVNLFAPRSSFGLPDDFRYFVDCCHELGLAVILDVVYNHLGPEGNYLRDFAPYFTRKYNTPWGEALDFDGRQQQDVRRFIVENAIYWLDEFHLDGLRLDAVHFMFDDQDHTILDAVRDGVQSLRERSDRLLHLIAEANVYDHDLVVGHPEKPSYDAAWSDCMMHSIYAIGVDGLALTPRDYVAGSDLRDALKHGFVFYYPPIEKADEQQRLKWFEPGDRSYLGSLVTALQTHDSVGNHPHGRRLHQLTSTEFQKAAAALMMLYPSIPMIFMGEEFATSAPFPFFVDFEDDRLRRAVDRGRANEYPQHAWDGALSPSDPRAFFDTKCPLESTEDSSVREWYKALIKLRKQKQAEGVLNWRHLETWCDIDASVYSIRYKSSNGGFAVYARLKPHDRELECHYPIDAGDSLILCSRDINRGAASESTIKLQTDHAVVIQF